MSEFSCPIVQIQSLSPVPNSDKLELTLIDETPCVVRKGQLSVGDLAVYIPLDSMVPMTKPQFQGLGIKTERELYRVKAVRLRGTYSEGLLVPYQGTSSVGTDMSTEWGIVKYEEPETPVGIQGTKSQQDRDITWAPKYNMENLLKNRSAIPEGVSVIVTEKVHGCNGRFAYGPDANGEVRLLVGSHNVWKKPIYSGKPFVLKLKAWLNKVASYIVEEPLFAEPQPVNDDVWWTVAKRLDMKNKLRHLPGLVFYGEVYGKVQDLTYSVGEERVRFAVFDIYDSGTKTWIPQYSVKALCKLMGFDTVPVLYEGPYVKETVDPLRTGVSVVDGVTMREGFVIRPSNPPDRNHKYAFKFVSEEYKLRKGNTTEFH